VGKMDPLKLIAMSLSLFFSHKSTWEIVS
jgi:hypothetical protein